VRVATLEPGEESGIVIDYTVKQVEGPQIFKYLVKSNDPTTPEKVLVLQLVCVLDK
jgi:hypothetical protein